MERKRHIGNDIVVIIYIESSDDEHPLGAALSFDPSCIESKFNRIKQLQCHVLLHLLYLTFTFKLCAYVIGVEYSI